MFFIFENIFTPKLSDFLRKMDFLKKFFITEKKSVYGVEIFIKKRDIEYFDYISNHKTVN